MSAGGLAGASWKVALSVTLLMQTVAAFLSQCIPVLAPLLTGGAGLPPEAAGHLAGLGTLGTLVFLVVGGPVLARMGPVRTLQAGAAIAAFGMGVAALGGTAALAAAALLIGLGYGPTPPAGSRILSATAPREHRSLIFSIKQAGAPLGGIMAGLGIAPLAAAWGTTTALAAAIAIALLAAAAIQPARTSLDVEREPGRRVGLAALFSRRNLVGPFASLRLHPLLPPVTLLGFSLATTQGCLLAFVVTWLTGTHGLGLAEAGLVYATMQAGGALARVLLGWVADRSGRPSVAMALQGIAAAILCALFALQPIGLGLAWMMALGALTGSLVASWNGIYQAEVARLAPPGRVADATAGSSTLCFLGYMISPAIFAGLVTLTGSWVVPQLLSAAQLLVVSLLVLPRILRAP